MTDKLVAEWRTRGGKHWYRLYLSERWGYHWKGENSLGGASHDGSVTFDEAGALAYMERLIASAKRCGQKSFARCG